VRGVPMSKLPPPEPPPKRQPARPIEGTRIESIEEIRQALQARHPSTTKEAGLLADTKPFQPSHRLPAARLCVLDDGKEDGEWVWLRGARLVIGRSEGDVVIPNDSMMSSRHAEIVRRYEEGRVRWYLIDLKSTNGTFVRVGSAVLKHGQEIALGSGCFSFDL